MTELDLGQSVVLEPGATLDLTLTANALLNERERSILFICVLLVEHEGGRVDIAAAGVGLPRLTTP